MSRRQPEPLPHRPPFRFAESQGDTVVVLPTVGAAESLPFPVPMTVLTEAMAQAILLLDPPEATDRLRLVGVDEAYLKQEVHPGERLEVTCRREGSFGRLRRYACRVLRGGGLVAQAKITVGY